MCILMCIFIQMTFVLDKLCVGGIDDASKPWKLKGYGISHILTIDVYAKVFSNMILSIFQGCSFFMQKVFRNHQSYKF